MCVNIVFVVIDIEMIKMFDLCCFCYFVIVVDELYFGCVVLCLCIVQLFLMCYIVVLEVDFGIWLFEWFMCVVQFMLVGVLFFEQVRIVVYVVDEVEVIVCKMVQGMVGCVVIGYVSFILMFDVFLDIICNVSCSMLEVELVFWEVLIVSQCQQIVDGMLDIGFGWLMVMVFGECICFFVVLWELFVVVVLVWS